MYKTQTVPDSIEDFKIANPSILPPQITTESIKEPTWSWDGAFRHHYLQTTEFQF